MHARPDLEKRRAALPGGPVTTCKESYSTEEANAAVTELQARQPRTRFSFGYCLACSLAPLVWGLPR
jgi:hypothetical protein